MATAVKDCVNYELNLQMCPCTSEDCAHRGICCECLQSHHASGSLTACMRGAKRDPGTLGLARRAAQTCSSNEGRNLAFCVCTYEPCERKGVCCNCVRNHFTPAGDDRVACMREM